MLTKNNTEQKLNIALLIYGRLNNDIEQFNNTMTKIIQNHNVDIFVSHSKNIKQEIINDFVRLYKPKKIIENDEKIIDLSNYPKRPETNVYNMCCMYKNKKNVFNLLDNYITEKKIYYDMIISFRCDLIFKQELDIKPIFNLISLNNILIPNPIFDWGGINDQIAIGNYETMKVYFLLYDFILEIVNKGVIVHPETILLYYLVNLKKQNIIRFNIEYYIKRYN